ncbi:MAG TPA: hypothetical protein VFV00_02750 [Acidimicrobiales bacterium]|nr:hypothetical protein [Acidimicrobiales bacterium]
MRRALVALLCAALTIAATGACGGSPPNQPTTGGDFADATCVDLANWAASVQRAFRSLQAVQQFDPSGNVTTTQTELHTLSTSLTDADRATERLYDGINGRRAPDVQDGEQIKKTILDALKELRGLGQAARTSIDSYRVDSATKDQAEKLKTDLQGVSDGVQNTLAQLTPLVASNEQLRAALQNSATCQRAASDLRSS